MLESFQQNISGIFDFQFGTQLKYIFNFLQKISLHGSILSSEPVMYVSFQFKFYLYTLWYKRKIITWRMRFISCGFYDGSRMLF